MSNCTVLDAKNIHKSFGGAVALDGASISLRPAKINLLIGANGSGKSTLVNAASGAYGIDAGAFALDGTDITRHPTHRRFQCGLMRTFQKPRLFDSLSVLDNLLLAQDSPGYGFGTALSGRYKKTERQLLVQALEILEHLEISHIKYHTADQLSGGQIKLLELGKTMMAQVHTILLDEPIAGIAPKLAHKIFEKITDICVTRNITFCIIEHRLDIALQYADYVYVMSDGRIIAKDTPDKILDNPKVIESYIQ